MTHHKHGDRVLTLNVTFTRRREQRKRRAVKSLSLNKRQTLPNQSSKSTLSLTYMKVENRPISVEEKKKKVTLSTNTTNLLF